VLREAGFAEPVLREVTLRKEATQPVQGWLVRAQLQAALRAASNGESNEPSALRTSNHG
jgi:hypothetical protein